MALDPRTFTANSCAATSQQQQTYSSNKKDFFDALGKVGDLEILNDIGFGKVSEGLRTLAKTSDSIRIGSLPASVMGAAATGANKVFDAVGINTTAAQTMLTNATDSLNPGVANRAYGQANAIYDKVRQGNFSLDDIPEVFSDLQNLDNLIGSIFTDPPAPIAAGGSGGAGGNGGCGASPYATDLISWAPKYKFLFVVQFEFTEPYNNAFKDIYASFVVKNSTRPNISFEHDDVNMYNYWTKVPKRTIYEPMTMRFYDDNLNQAMSLYNAYLRAMSPVSNLSFESKMEAVSGVYEGLSMDYSGLNQGSVNPGPAKTHNYAASYGPTSNVDIKNIFRRITLFHVYGEGTKMNVYKFFNPKIISMELDDLDMADNGNGNEVSFQFAYDSMHIQTGYPISSKSPYDITALSGGSLGATYPIKDNSDPNASVASDPRQPPGNEQDFLADLANTAGESLGNISAAAGELASDAIIYGAHAANVASGALDSGRQLISNAYEDASAFIGSKFT